jgi:hypothetical protein
MKESFAARKIQTGVSAMKVFRKSVIGADAPDGPLLIRYVLFRCAAWGVYLHHLMRSDHERALHDHPWPFVSIVLAGGYSEIHDQTLDHREARQFRAPGSVLVRPAEWRHRFVLTKPAWTLVIVGRRCRKWGFFTSKGWCWWRKYDPQLGICEERVIWRGGKD